MTNRYLLASVGFILLVGYSVHIIQHRYNTTYEGSPLGISLILVGIAGLAWLPSLYESSNSPLYIGSAALLAISSVGVGLFDVKVTRLTSLPQIFKMTGVTLGVYFSGVVIPIIRQTLVEVVTEHTVAIISLWHTVSVREGPEYGYQSEIVFTNTTPQMVTFIEIACTGIGAFAVVCGLLYQANTSNMYKLLLVGFSAVFIYIANLIRNVFVAISFADQWFSNSFTDQWIVGEQSQSELTSFVIAETYISQIGTAILLSIILYYVFVYTELLDSIFDPVTEDFSLIETTMKQYQEELTERNDVE